MCEKAGQTIKIYWGKDGLKKSPKHSSLKKKKKKAKD